MQSQTEVRRLDNWTYDVFRGKGWDDHVRIRQGRSSTYRLSGSRISKPDLHELHDVLAPNMPTNYGQSVDQLLSNINAINTR